MASCLSNPANFADWYTSSDRNATLAGELLLFDDGAGAYVNRYGGQGEQFQISDPVTQALLPSDGNPLFFPLHPDAPLSSQLPARAVPIRSIVHRSTCYPRSADCMLPPRGWGIFTAEGCSHANNLSAREQGPRGRGVRAPQAREWGIDPEDKSRNGVSEWRRRSVRESEEGYFLAASRSLTCSLTFSRMFLGTPA
jgi:hypothetical protein